MRTFKQNANIIKAFMVYGVEYFYLNYYLDGETFINNIYVAKRDVRHSIELAKQVQVDFDNEYIDDKELVNNILKHQILTGLLQTDSTKVTKDEMKLYQFIAEGITGNIEAMFTLLQDVVQYESIDEETVKLAEDIVYAGIRKMWVHLLKLQEYEAS